MRRLTIAAGVLAVTVATLWSAYWVVAASFIENKIELAFSKGAPGLELKLEDASVSGFPSTFDVELKNVSIGSRDGFSWSTPGATLTAASLDPTRIDIDLSQPQAIGGRWGAMSLKTTEAQVIALFGKTAQLPLQDLRLALGGVGLSHANGNDFAAEKVVAVIKNRAGADPGIYHVEAEATGANISGLFPGLPSAYQRLGPITAAGDVFYTAGWDAEAIRGSAPKFRGAIFERASVSFGNSDIELGGQLRVDPEGTLSGEVKLTVTNWREILGLAKAMGKIDAETEQIFSDMLADVEALNGKPGTLELPLTIRKGTVTYGILTLGLIPPIR